MAVINGKWKLTSMSNMEAFHEAIKTPADFKAKIEAAKKDPANKIDHFLDISDGKLERSMVINGAKTWGMVYKIGAEEDSTGPDGRTCKVNNQRVSDSKITFNNKGSDFEATGSMEVEGDELTLNMTSKGVTAVQKFARA